MSVALAAGLVFLIHGYHPYTQDASIYVAGIEKHLDVSLFRSDAAFVEGHTRLSFFPGIMATGIRCLHVSLHTFLLLTYVSSILAFLSGCNLLAFRLFRSKTASWTATLIAASCFTLPASATALLIMDPYVTARTISTPSSLFAIAFCIERSWIRTAVFTLIVLAMHPLMSIYLVSFLALLILLDKFSLKAAAVLCMAGFAVGGLLSALGYRASISEASKRAALSRTYYFLSCWRWYELLGLVAPLLLMAFVWRNRNVSPNARRLCAACVLSGSTAVVISLCFVHTSHPDLMMRLQVLRAFHTVYLVGLVMAGGYLGSLFWTTKRWIISTVLALASFSMFLGSKLSYPGSGHIELLSADAVGPLKQAFIWIRGNTPPGAIFASDTEFFDQLNQDALGFRAITQRSILTDTKDEAIASLFPLLADEWARRREAQSGLNRLGDSERALRLHGYGVNWLLLAADASTSLSCPYRNTEVAVCSLDR